MAYLGVPRTLLAGERKVCSGEVYDWSGYYETVLFFGRRKSVAVHISLYFSFSFGLVIRKEQNFSACIDLNDMRQKDGRASLRDFHT